MAHTSYAPVVAKRVQGRVEGGKASQRRRAAERARRAEESFGLGSEAEIAAYLGVAARLAVKTGDSSHAAAASKVAEIAAGLLEVPKLKSRIADLEQVVEEQREAIRRAGGGR